MKTPINLSTNEFDSTTNEGTTIVDFWAPWCGPCQHQLKILDQLGEQIDDSEDVTLAKVNLDDEPQLAQKFGIRSIPTLLVIQDGEVKETFTGVTTAPKLREAINAVSPATA